MIHLTPAADIALKALRQARVDLIAQARTAEDVPLPAPMLDVASRASSPTRLFKHLQQMCLIHEWGFRTANKVKAAYLVDAYCALVDAGNPLGIYAISRSILEFHAFVAFVSSRLRKVASSGEAWRTRGEQFFAILARARFGTSGPTLKSEASAGVPEAYLKPFHINDCRRELAKLPGFEWVEAHYDTLCDHVHHNAPSQRVSAADVSMAPEILIGQSRMVFGDEMPVVRYQFGSEFQLSQAIVRTAERSYESLRGLMDAVSACPSSPFSEGECLEMTGDPHGFGQPRRT